ncbi:MAG: hypothetical protein M3314_05935 [Actinomycetota bacterium]|nr:hypothetical protein [Actinomycetota bacterium]
MRDREAVQDRFATTRFRLVARVCALGGLLVFVCGARADAHVGVEVSPRAQASQAAPGDDLVEVILRILCSLTGLPQLCPPEQVAQAPTPPASTTTAPSPSSRQAVAPQPPPGPAGRLDPPAVQAGPTTSAPPTAPVPSDEVPDTTATAAAPPPPTMGEPSRTPSSSRATRPADRKLNLSTPEEVDFSPRALGAAAGISILGMILLGFPSELFNKTLQANYGRLRRIFPWIIPKTGPTPLAAQVLALVFSCLVAGLIGSFQKVHEWSVSAVVVSAIAIAFGFFVTVAVFELAGAAAGAQMGLPRRRFRSYQGALPIVALFVGVSALGRLQPAYVYGHIAGSRWRDEDEPSPRGRAFQTVAASVALLLVALGCWGARAFVTSPFLTDLLAGVVIVGLNRLAFSMLPATFLDGHAIASYSRALWVSVFVPILAVFLLLVLLPTARQAPARVLMVSIVLFVIFAGLSVALWATFRQSARRETVPLGVTS